ncbi:MAG: XVIPCD domain-containing protein [Lysobacteraceae bacterium]
MADTPAFQGHHVIEQEAFRQSRLLQSLARNGLFDLHGPSNIINLPADQTFAARMGVSPHPGGPLGAYTDELRTALRDLEVSPDGRATLRGDQAASQRIAARVGELTETLKVGLVNGDLVSNTPQGMTPEQANARIRTFFGDLDGYRLNHAGQIAELRTMQPSEARWAAITQSERNVGLALDAIQQPGSSTLSERWGGRPSLGMAVAEANQAGRLPISDATEVRLRSAFPQEMPPTLMRPPIAPEPRGTVGEGAVPRETAPTPGAGRAMRIAGGAGVALMAYDFVTTGHQVVTLRAQGNEAAAASAETHFVGRNIGGVLGGVGAGFLYGAAGGAETGPGALITGLVGAGVGAYLGERWAQQRDIDRVFTQTDRGGNEWTRDPADPKGAWLRTTTAPNAAGGSGEIRLVAAGRLVDELNYRAANDSYSLGLGNPPRPQDPFSIVGAQDQPGWQAGPWHRNAETGAWSRTLAAEGMLPEFQMIPEMRNEGATPAQTAALERQSALIIAQNAANTPAATAARYEIAYQQVGWREFATAEPVPPAIRNAAGQTQTLQASDGAIYTRDANGGWSTPGTLYGTSPATGNVREELDRTWRSQQEGLRELAGYAAEARANPTPTAFDMRASVADAYARAGMTRSEADIDAATRAVGQDHVRAGLGPSPYTLQVRSDGVIETLVGRDDRRMEVKSQTTPAEIERARAQPAAPADAPRADTPATPAAPATRSPETSSSDRASLDQEANPRYGMFRQALAPVLARDAELGRTPDGASVRLAASMTAEARGRGLESIAFAQFSQDGSRFYMADTADPASPLARTAVGDVGQGLQQSVADSSRQVAQIDQAQAQTMAQSLAAQQTQAQAQAGPVIQGPRLV